MITAINKHVSFKGKNGVVPEAVRKPLRVAYTLMKQNGVYNIYRNEVAVTDMFSSFQNPIVYIELPKGISMKVNVTTGEIVSSEKAVYRSWGGIFNRMKTSLDGFVAGFGTDKVYKAAKPVVRMNSITKLFKKAEGSYYL